MIFKLTLIVISGLLLFVTMCQTASGQKKMRSDSGFISISDLNGDKVIGSLGYALGETVVVEGIVADENLSAAKI